MKSNNIYTLGDVIRKLMKNPKIANKLNDLDALDLCKKIIGHQLQNYITDLEINHGVLYLKINSAAVRNELFYKRTDLINRINEGLKKEVIKEIVLK